MGSLVGSGSITQILQFAVLPVAKVLLMCGLGLLLATTFVNILTVENRKILSKVGALIVYTFVYHMLAPPDIEMQETFVKIPSGAHGEDAEAQHGTPLSATLLLNEALTDQASAAPLLLSPDSHAQPRHPSRTAHQLFKQLGALVMSIRILDILQPPVVASLLALFVGAVPWLKSIMFLDSSPLLFVIDSLNMMGKCVLNCVLSRGAMIPCIMLVLGGNLVGGPGSSQLGLRTTVAITVSRLFLAPVVGLVVVTSADKLGLLP
eukprot:jgi/Mesen1/1746/ME001390S00745